MSAPSAADAFLGALDVVDAEVIAGWAWDQTRPDAPIEVEVYDGDALLATVLADQFREDLIGAGIGNGKHGFALPTPAGLQDGKSHAIRVKCTATAVELHGSPKTFAAAPASS